MEIAEKMGVAEVIAFATPFIYYEMSGQMKTLLDRANALFASDYAFRDIYLLTAAAEEDDQVPARAESGLTGGSTVLKRPDWQGQSLPEE